MKIDLFQSCGHCWVFQSCWHIECSTFTASSSRVWNSSTGIPSPPLALFVVMPPKAHLTTETKHSNSTQALPSMDYLSQEHWSGLPFPPPGNPPNPRTEPMSPASPALSGRFFTTEPPGVTFKYGKWGTEKGSCIEHRQLPLEGSKESGSVNMQKDKCLWKN